VFIQDEETYVRELLAGLNAYPAYYAHMAPANSAGPSGPDLSPPGKADPAGIRRRIEAGEWVVDLRSRAVFAAGHVPGSLNFGPAPFGHQAAWQEQTSASAIVAMPVIVSMSSALFASSGPLSNTDS
jgi:hypothetical protein